MAHVALHAVRAVLTLVVLSDQRQFLRVFQAQSVYPEALTFGTTVRGHLNASHCRIWPLTDLFSEHDFGRIGA